jgi:peptidoglycan/xylan/chitin deacetylase (PgdA/CDA1 family)
MHRFFARTPWWVSALLHRYTWRVAEKAPVVYLTFDDGPHPTITPWVLEELRKYNARATFFCIGKNVEAWPAVYQQLLNEGHSVGNHTHNHLNGWKTDLRTYTENVRKAAALISTNLFRPPYGRIRAAQARALEDAMGGKGVKVIMWDVLSADFDTGLSPAECTRRVLRNYRPGSIIVFHDSEKAYPNLKETLPAVLAHLAEKKYICKAL